MKLLLLPKPKKIELLGQNFNWSESSKLYLDKEIDTDLSFALENLQQDLKESIGRKLSVEYTALSSRNHRGIHIFLTSESDQDKEGYQLNILERGVEISARTTQGLFYA